MGEEGVVNWPRDGVVHHLPGEEGVVSWPRAGVVYYLKTCIDSAMTHDSSSWPGLAPLLIHKWP